MILRREFDPGEHAAIWRTLPTSRRGTKELGHARQV